MTRLEAFNSFVECPVNCKILERLSWGERLECVEFIKQNDELDLNMFAEKVNRWYLDQPHKPKHLTDMWALVLQANTKVHFKGRR
jgi:phage-related protein